MDPQKGVAKLLEFLLKDLEKGRTMPEGWDADMPAEFANDPRVVELTELNGAQRWTLRTAQDWLNERLDQKPDDVDWMAADRKSVVEGKRGSVRVDLGGHRH